MSPVGAQAIDATANEAGPEREAALKSVYRSHRLLRAVEQYKAACQAQGIRPDEEGNWLVLLAALGAEDLRAEA